MKKKLLLALSYVLVIALTLTATVAYFTDTDSAVNVMTVGNIDIEQHEYQRAEGVAHVGTATEGSLVPFKQGQLIMPAYPVDNTAYSAEQTNLFKWGPYVTAAGAGNGLWNDEKLGNVMDKMVFVENTGKNDLYYRTIIAFECPEGMEYSEGPDKEFMVNVNAHHLFDWEEIGYITVDDTRYLLEVVTYQDVLTSGEISRPSLLQVVMTHNVNQEKAALLGGSYEILVMTQAVQADMGVDGMTAEKALNAAFKEATAQNASDWFGGSVASTEVATDADLAAALAADDEHILVNLDGDLTVDVAAWATDAFGGASTEDIIIVGNGHTLTFRQTNSDWNNVITNNGATLTIIDAKITNAGYNDGPWNRHDINFACDVVLSNVVSDKALAFKGAATLNNVTIDDANTSDTYAIWIQPNGQTVTLNDCTIDMLDCSDGRGIKIDEQYVSDPAKVTLNVSDTTFKTEEKSAILVKSKAGAEINLDNVDISGVAADPFNAVWVDEASVAYADLVVVNGANKVIEGNYKITSAESQSEFNSAVATSDAVVLGDGEYVVPSSVSGKTLTIAGNGDTVIDITTVPTYAGLPGATITFENVVIKSDQQGAGYNRGFAHTNKVTYNNCEINGTLGLNTDTDFNNCTFNISGDYYSLWTWGAPNVNITGCTFNSDGKALLLYGTANTKLTVNGCTFNDNGGLADLKAAIEIGNDYDKSYELIVNNTVVNGYEINDKGINTGTTLWANKNSMPQDKLNVVVDGVDVY